MKVNHSRTYWLSALASVLLLSGCAVNPSAWLSFSNNETNNETNDESATRPTEKVKQENNTSNRDFTAAQALVNTADASATQKKVDSLAAEWAALKPEITRLIELEAELGFIVNELAKQDGLNSLQNPDMLLTEYTPQNMAPMQDITPQDIVIEDDFVAAAQKLGQANRNNIVVGQAMPIMDVPQDASIDTKFSAPLKGSVMPQATANKDVVVVDRTLPTNNNLPATITSHIDSKFNRTYSNTSPKTIVGSIPSLQRNASTASLSTASSLRDKCDVGSTTNTIGVHLISIKDQAKVGQAAHELLNKFAGQLCSSFKVNNVVVKGEQYFSIRFGPYLSEQDAQQACSSIRAKGQYCRPTEFVGQLM